MEAIKTKAYGAAASLVDRFSSLSRMDMAYDRMLNEDVRFRFVIDMQTLKDEN